MGELFMYQDREGKLTGFQKNVVSVIVAVFR